MYSQQRCCKERTAVVLTTGDGESHRNVLCANANCPYFIEQFYIVYYTLVAELALSFIIQLYLQGSFNEFNTEQGITTRLVMICIDQKKSDLERPIQANG
ncbi:hypothetical protein GDO81_004214 [Engystomops pustulosus]|uniref:Uncharacterized protein n=1 Tax=Engystomops pustulosus TaxID=76066 RepID=A0AAV6ZUK6_ENGPU|nr:hypothetical protein GDO81_004214 [Engystomops pustulosus]